MNSRPASAPRALVVAAFAALYVTWGLTYFFIRMAIETIPPFLMAGSRFLLAGLMLYAVVRPRGERPTLVQWKDAFIIGFFLLLIGNGGVAWAETRVPSSLTALLVAVVPLWMILLEWLRGGERPTRLLFAGLAAGFCGIAFIALSRDSTGHMLANPVGVISLLCTSMCWAIGSLYSRHARRTRSVLQFIAMQMIAGGVLQLLTGALLGESHDFHWQAVSRASLLAFAYLVIGGAIIGFTAYAWLLQVSTPARVSTYAYVNPLIAVLFGCTFGHEIITSSVFAGGALIVCAVTLIVSKGKKFPPQQRPLSPAALAE
jgi:drug/metabolite transporter (DMT)-like permease